MWNEYVYSYSAKKLSLFHRPGVGVLNIGPVNSNCGNWRGIVVDLLGIGTGVTPEVSEQADEGEAGVHSVTNAPVPWQNILPLHSDCTALVVPLKGYLSWRCTPTSLLLF